MVDIPPTLPCRVCASPTTPAGERTTAFSGDYRFKFAHCPECGYTQVDNPRTDFDRLYDADYYAGRGADPITNYSAELANPRTIRKYEWAGLLSIATDLGGRGEDLRWLDFGCGLGGSTRFAIEHGLPHSVGFDEGHARDMLVRDGVPHIDREDFEQHRGTFDVVTSIDVIEHVLDPVAFLSEIASLLRPGGTLFVVTGNAEPYRGRVAKWSYSSVTDVHIGFFEPRTLRTAYQRAGLIPLESPAPHGLELLIRYKILRNLRVKNCSAAERLLPWTLLCSLADRKVRLSDMPMARRPE